MCVGTPEDVKKDGCKATPGIGKRFYYALETDVATVPAPPATGPLADLNVTVDDFVMVATKTFFEIDSDNNAAGLNVSFEGEVNNLSGKSTFTFMVSGENRALEGWLKSFVNADLIFVVTDKDGTQRILGNKLTPANVVTPVDYTSGVKNGDQKAVTITIEAYGGMPTIFEGPAGVPLPA